MCSCHAAAASRSLAKHATVTQISAMIFFSTIYDLWTRTPYGAPNPLHLGRQPLHRAVDSLRQGVDPPNPENWVTMGVYLVPSASEMFCHSMRGPIVPSHRQSSHDSSGMAFSGNAATSSSGGVLSRSPENESSTC